MHTRTVVVALLLSLLPTISSACSSSAKPEPPGTAPNASPPANPKWTGDSCTSSADCTAPAECIHVVGMRPESARQECWVTCGDGTKCPDGLTCTMVHDGPGEVCRRADD